MGRDGVPDGVAGVGVLSGGVDEGAATKTTSADLLGQAGEEGVDRPVGRQARGAVFDGHPNQVVLPRYVRDDKMVLGGEVPVEGESTITSRRCP